MVAAEGREETGLVPPHQQFGVRAADEAAYVRAHEGLARETERHEHRQAQRQCVPGAAVVAGPHGSVPLDPRVSRAGDDIRALIGEQSLQTLIRGAGFVEREHVAVAGVGRIHSAIVCDHIHLRLTGLVRSGR